MQVSNINVSVIPGQNLQVGDFFLCDFLGARRLGLVVQKPEEQRDALAFCDERSEIGTAIHRIGADVFHQSAVLKIDDPMEIYINSDPVSAWKAPGAWEHNLDSVGIYPDGKLRILFAIGGKGIPTGFVELDISKDAICLVPAGKNPEAPVAMSRQWHLQTAIPGKEQVIYCPPPRVRDEE